MMNQGEIENLKVNELKDLSVEEKERIQKLYENIESLGKAHKPFDRKRPDNKKVSQILGLNFSDKEIDQLLSEPKMTSQDIEIQLKLKKDKYQETEKQHNENSHKNDAEDTSKDKPNSDSNIQDKKSETEITNEASAPPQKSNYFTFFKNKKEYFFLLFF